MIFQEGGPSVSGNSRQPFFLFLAALSTRQNVAFHSFECLCPRRSFTCRSKRPGHRHLPRHSSRLKDLHLPFWHRMLSHLFTNHCPTNVKKINSQPEKVDTDTGLIRGFQHGYNQCNSTTEGPNSLCQTSFINSIDGSHCFFF